MFGIYLQSTYGLSALVAGIALIPFSVSYFTGSLIASKFAKRIRCHHFLISGQVITLLGLLFFCFVTHETFYPILVLGLVLFAFGFVCTNIASIPLALLQITSAQSGLASGKIMMIRWLGGATGAAIVSFLFSTARKQETLRQLNDTHALHASIWLLVGLNLIGLLISFLFLKKRLFLNDSPG